MAFTVTLKNKQNYSHQDIKFTDVKFVLKPRGLNGPAVISVSVA